MPHGDGIKCVVEANTQGHMYKAGYHLCRKVIQVGISPGCLSDGR